MKNWVLAAALLALAGCAVQPPAPPVAPAMSLTAVGFDKLPGWQQDHPAEALPAFLAGCGRMSQETLGGSGETLARGGAAANWQAACTAGRTVPPGDDAAARAFFEAQFQPYAILNNGTPDGLFTGYYEPEVRGARSPGAGYDVPLYSRPYDLVAVDLNAFPDAFVTNRITGRVQAGQLVPVIPVSLKTTTTTTQAKKPVAKPVPAKAAPAKAAPAPAPKPAPIVAVDLTLFPEAARTKRVIGRVQDGMLVPYYDRAAIVGGALANKRLDLIWLADRVDAFFLQIQGSGRIRLPDNKIVRVTYSGQNGLPYVAIGRVLVDQGQMTLEQVTMQSIRAWLNSHPTEATGVMDQNPSYVFFREVNGMKPDEGPPGALGLGLTPGRSIAVDRSFLPLGAPVFVDTTDPLDGSKFQRLMLAQDLGGAIRGPVRADIFWGWGQDAEDRAGRMRAKGQQYILLPKG